MAAFAPGNPSTQNEDLLMSDCDFSESARDGGQMLGLGPAREFAATAASQCRHAAECEIARQSAQHGDTTPRVCLCHPWEAARDEP